MAGPLISMRDINKYYAMGEEQAHIFKDANLSVASGEYLSILGPSGSGKSTLMNSIGCLDTPTSGSGIIASLNMTKGNAVAEGSAVATLYADDGMRIEATVSETDLLSFHVGDSGIAEFTYLNDGGTSVRGMFVIISRLGEASSSDAESEESDAVKIFLTILLPQFVMADIEPHRLLQVLRLVQAFQERVRDWWIRI